MTKDDGCAAVTILRTNGEREDHRVGRHLLMDWCLRMIGASVCDTVNLRDGRVMLVDDEGYETKAVTLSPGHFALEPVKANKPVNVEATTLYHGVCRPGTTHQIVGDVAICLDRDFA